MPEGIPQNAGYAVAAYICAAVILIVYSIVLFRRGRARR